MVPSSAISCRGSRKAMWPFSHAIATSPFVVSIQVNARSGRRVSSAVCGVNGVRVVWVGMGVRVGGKRDE